MVTPEENDDLIDRLIEHHPGFAKLLECRLHERTVSVDSAARRLRAAVSPKAPKVGRSLAGRTT
jgi:hypothetical protein